MQNQNTISVKTNTPHKFLSLHFLSTLILFLFLAGCSKSGDNEDQQKIEIETTAETEENQAAAPTSTPLIISTPADSIPADSIPADSIPADSTPADSIPADSTPADSIPAEESSFKGRVVKGIISNAIIKAYPIIIQNDIYVIDSNASPITSRTNGDGYYQVKPGKGKNDHYYYLEMITDSQSQMMCDFHTGCTSSQTGAHVNFGEAFTLSSGFTLTTVVKSKAGKINHAPISPLTHLTTQYIKTLPERFSPSNITISEDYIEAKFGLGDRALSLLPSDLTALSETKKLKEEELRLGILSAAFAPIIETSGWDDISALSMKDLFLNAYNLAQFLGSRINSGQHLKTLSVIETQSYTQYKAQTEQTLVIDEQPKSIDATEGDDVTLKVVASSSDTIHYQWQKDNIELVGATSDTLSIANISLSDDGIYSVSVSSGNESLNSLVALVSVAPKDIAVTITNHPQPIVTVEGEQAYFEVSAEGTGPLAYQWQKGGSIIPGTNSSRLSFNPVTLDDEGTYSVTVSNDINSLQSNFANITVNESIAALEIIQQPISTETLEGNNTTFSVSATGGGFIAYQWRKNAIAISNAYEQSYSIPSSSLTDTGTYDVVLTNSIGSITSASAILSVIADINPITINQQPQAQTINEGESSIFTVLASGGGTLNFEWYIDNQPIANSNNATLSILSSQLSDQGSYHVIVSNEVSTQSSQTAFLSITPQPDPEPAIVNLSWTPPEFRDDDTALDTTEISAYEIEYKNQSTNLSTTIKVDGVLSSTSISLMPAEYAIKIATIDANQLKGQFSEAFLFSIGN